MIASVYYLTLCAWILPADCKAEVAKAYQQLKRAYGTEQKNLFLKYSIKTTKWNDEAAEESISLYLRGEKSKVVSSKVTLFQDKEMAVGIDRENKRILVSKPLAENWKANQLKSMTVMFDSLFHRLKVISCESSCQDDRSMLMLRKISFSIQGTDEDSAAPESVTYWLLEKSPEIKKIELQYGKESEVQSISFRMEEWKLDYKENLFAGSALSQIMTNENKLIAKYKDFELIDTRK